MSELSIDPRKTICKTCRDPSKVRTDQTQGTIVCTGCGLVLEDHCLDESREWRSFASDGVDAGSSRERADFMGAADEMTGEVAGTTIGGSDARSQKLQRVMRMADARGSQVQSESVTMAKQVQSYTIK
ncbi:unnamed protein product, partial [Polarella glacialis]